MLRRLFVILLLLLLLPAAAMARPLIVVTSFSILKDMAHEVGGEHVQVTALVGAGADTHVYEPTPADARILSGADLVIVNGLGFEGWMDRLMGASDYKGPLVTASKGIMPIMVNGAPDPHAWQDIRNGELYVATIRDALCAADPANAASYRKNAERYITQLAALDVWVKAQIAAIPEQQRRAIYPHDAMRYFTARYGVEFLSPLGISTEGEATASDIARIIDAIRTEHVHVVFFENMGDPRMVQELVNDGGALIGGTLYSDALSVPEGEAPTYVAMFKHNVEAIVQAMHFH